MSTAPEGTPRAHTRAPMILRTVGERVMLTGGSGDDGATGTVVSLSVWTDDATDAGDRVVQMDRTGARLVWDARFLADAPVVADADGTPLHPGAIVTAPNGDRVQVTRVTVARDGGHPLAYGAVIGGPWHGLALVHRAATLRATGETADGPAPVEYATRSDAVASPRSTYDRVMGAIVNGTIGAVHATVGFGVA